MTPEEQQRRIAIKMQQTGFHYHGDFREVIKVLSNTSPNDLAAIETFIDRVLQSVRKPMPSHIQG